MREFSRFGALLSVVLGTFGHSSHSGDNEDNATTTAISGSIAVNITSPLGSSSSTTVSTLGNGTCPSRTANYITHTLPQQCLRTDRTVANATKTAGGDFVSSHNGSIAADDAVKQHAVSSDSFGGESLDSSLEHSTTENPRPTDSGAISTTSNTEVASASSESATTTLSQSEAESDSPLDNANFLSFEEWKKQNLAKAEPILDPNGALDAADRQRPGLSNALDSLGEEGEIDIDFSGFGGRASAPRQQQAAYRSVDGADSVQTAPSTQASRSKDAGKTCKERTNYASFDCAATMLKTNPECSSAASVLVENKDSYMLNTCSADNKFFIVELCNDILVDTIVLANYEFFSSIFRHFRVSVSDRYPVKMDKWVDLGTFEARNSRDVQPFLIEHSQIWARYLRIEFLTHYGGEYYCPVSLLRVHGTTMLEELRPQQEIAGGEETDEEIALEPEAIATPVLAPDLTKNGDEPGDQTLQADAGDGHGTAPSDEMRLSESPLSTEAGLDGDDVQPSVTSAPKVTNLEVSGELPMIDEMTCASNMTSATTENTFGLPSLLANITIASAADHGSSTSTETGSGTSYSGSKSMGKASSAQPSSAESLSNEITTTTPTLAEDPDTSVASNFTTETPSLSAAVLSSNSTAADMSSPSLSDSSTSTATANSTRATSSTASAPPQPQPSTQESFFKSIHKRLQQLEANSTLSLQYIEEQSRILRDAFSKVEKRQISSTTNFLTNLNDTVMTELHGFRQAYDQLWQSTVIELDGQREQYQRDMLAMSSRLTLVAEELVWQKRVGVLQSTLLIICIALVLFARGSSSSGPLEVSLMQQMVNKSQAAMSRAGWESPPASPSPQSRSPVRLFRRKLWRSITDPLGSGNVTDATDSRPQSKDGPEEVYVSVDPPTPVSKTPVSSTVASPGKDTEAGLDDEEADEMLDIRESRSGPSTPRGTRERPDKPHDEVSVDIDPFEL